MTEFNPDAIEDLGDEIEKAWLHWRMHVQNVPFDQAAAEFRYWLGAVTS